MHNSIKFIIIFLCIGSTLLTQSQSEIMNWEFSNFNTLAYNYKQIMTNKESFGLDDDEPIKSYSEISGLLIVEVKNADSADVILKNAKVTTFIKDSLGNRFDTRSQTVPDLVYLNNLKENGSVDGSYNKQTELFAKVLFPIINNVSASPCIIQFPLSTSFDIEGTLVEIKGKNTIDFTFINPNFLKLNTHIYAKKDNIKVVEGKHYSCKIEGDSRFSFDAKKKYFTDGKIELNMLLKQTKDNRKTSNTLVDIDVNITLKLIKVD